MNSKDVVLLDPQVSPSGRIASSRRIASPMRGEALKIARSNERVAMMNTLKEIITNPVVDVMIAFLLIEYFQGHDTFDSKGNKIAHIGNGGWVSESTGDALEVALGAYLLAPGFTKTAEQLAPLVKALAPLIPAIAGG